MKKILFLAIIVVITLLFSGCPDLFWDLDSELDPDSETYQGFETVDDAADVVMESIEWDGNTLVFRCSFCLGVETYYLELSSSDTDFSGNILTTETGSENLWEISGNLITADTFYYRFRAGDGDWSDVESFSGINPDPPPGEVTDLEVSVDDGSVTLTWTNPTDADFSHCELMYGTAGTVGTEYDGTPNNTGTTVTGLTNRTEYTFTVYTVDDSDNRSDGASITAVPDDLYLADYGFVLKTIIPEGETVTFTMGDDTDTTTDNDEHEVILGRSFLMSETEITQKQYFEVTGASPSASNGTGDEYPVYNVNWYDAVNFCNTLSILEDLTPVYYIDEAYTSVYTSGTSVYWNTDVDGYRLPTEAEWEYAALGGEDYPYAGSLLPNQVAWYDDNSDGTTHEIKGKTPNAYGLYDMSGNISEWCWDWYGSGIENPAYYFYHYDPIGPDSGAKRILRGGCYWFSVDYTAIRLRYDIDPQYAYYYCGFRVVRQTGTTDITPPAEISDLTVKGGSSMATLTWTDPSDEDFDHCEIWYGTDGTTDTEFTGSVNGTGTEVTGLNTGELYSFKVNTVDNSENRSIGFERDKYILSETKIIASDGAANDRFGMEVDISADGELMITGAYYHEGNIGAAYVYKKSGSSWEEKKLSGGGLNTTAFGVDVAVSGYGQNIVVGSIGKAHYFKWSDNSWIEMILSGSGIDYSDNYGRSVDISSDGATIIVGAYTDDASYTDSGSAFIHTWNGESWDQLKITASDGYYDDQFGNAVALSGDGKTIVIGAYMDDDDDDFHITDSGSVYVYKWNESSWEETKLSASTGIKDERFGYSVNISEDGNTIIAGSYYGTTQTVYVFDWNGISWEETLLTPTAAGSATGYGHSIDLSSDGEKIVIGARNGTGYTLLSGTVYIYTRNIDGWDEIILEAFDGEQSDRFGEAVAISDDGTSLIVGAEYDNDNGDTSGSIYRYEY